MEPDLLVIAIDSPFEVFPVNSVTPLSAIITVFLPLAIALPIMPESHVFELFLKIEFLIIAKEVAEPIPTAPKPKESDEVLFSKTELFI